MTRQFARAALPAALLTLGFALTAVAQGTSNAPATPNAGSTASKPASSKANASSSSLDHADRKFVEEAAAGGMAEVEMGQLASQRAQSGEVKQFAQRMVQDHSKANDELKQVASSKGIQLPGQTDKSHQKKMDKLQKLSGADFDKAYMDDMVKDHKKDVKEFQKQSKSAKDADVKGFAAKTLPTLQEHLQMAENAQKAAKGEKKAGK
jgi:putative membrane protein